MISRSAKVDRLSRLPEELLSHILSLMPTKYAMRTSILSKRWRYHWMFVTSLDFDFNNGHDFEVDAVHVDRVLDLCKTSQLKLFRLHFYGHSVQKSRISSFISKAVRLNVCELDIDVEDLELPACLFTCKTLTTLKLYHSRHLTFDHNFMNTLSRMRWNMPSHNVWNMPYQNVWNLPSTVNLSCLKTLDICVYEEPSGDVFKLIHGCPLIESLTLRINFLAIENEYNFNIPTLKRLELYIMEKTPVINKVILNVPNLQYLNVIGSLLSPFVIEDLSSLVEATFLSYDCVLGELLRGIFSGDKSFSWYSPTIIPCMEFPIFLDFEPMELAIRSVERSPTSILEYAVSYQLRGLYYKSRMIRLMHSDPIYPPAVPDCMLSTLKALFGNAKVLKKVTIENLRLPREDELQFCAQLLKFPRASTYCAVRFVGKHIVASCGSFSWKMHCHTPVD